jgi:CHASE3 domain sensor protein
MPFIFKKNFIILINVLIFIAITLLIYLNIKGTNRRKQAEHWVEHTYKVINQAEKLLRLTTQEVMASRGYILTGNKSYLNPLLESRKDIDSIIISLKSLTADNPVQQKQIGNLEGLIQIRKQITDSLNLLRDIHFDSAIAVTNSHIGKIYMDSIKNEIHDFTIIEYSLLQKRQEHQFNLRNREELVKAILIFSLLLLI